MTDAWGREYFLNYRLEDMPLYDPRRWSTTPDVRHLELPAMHWHSKAHLHLPCHDLRKKHSPPFKRVSREDPTMIFGNFDGLFGRVMGRLVPSGPGESTQT